MTQEEAKKAYEEQMRRMYAEAMRQQQEAQYLMQQQRVWAEERQRMLDDAPRQRYSLIVAVDNQGGFGKDGKIPWHYPEDFRWFSKHTKGHICVMGKTTYLEINERLGEKAKDSVLPDRKCFVVSSTLTQDEVPNATVIPSVFDVPKHLDVDDVEKIVYFIGGQQIYEAGLSMADTALVTVINQDFGCDRFFPTHMLDKCFRVNRVFKSEHTNDLRFVEFVRR